MRNRDRIERIEKRLERLDCYRCPEEITERWPPQAHAILRVRYSVFSGGVLYHGGCHGCTQQLIKGGQVCEGCQYRRADWNLPSLNNERTSVRLSDIRHVVRDEIETWAGRDCDA